jgi:hypothetical protein
VEGVVGKRWTVGEEEEGSSTEVKVLKMGGRMEENFVIGEGEAMNVVMSIVAIPIIIITI